MRKMLFVFNPRSGREQIKDHLMEILDISTRAGYEIRVHTIQKQNDAVRVVYRCDNRVDLVVCSGGDGTLNGAVSGMMKLKELPLLGYIPARPTNDFTSSLEIPKRMPQVALDIMEGKPFAVGIGTFCHDRYSMYIVAFGAFAEVSYLISQDREDLLDHQVYMTEGMKSLAGLKPHRMKVEWEGQILGENFAFDMVTNTRSVGNFKRLVDQSVALNGGLSEVLLTRIPRAPVGLSNTVSYISLRKKPNEYVYRLKISSIQMTSG